MSIPKPVVLCILDGWGQREDRFANAPALANTPNFDRLMATCPHATLITHGPDVGLPSGQMGNSEVGHTNIGAGRVVAMDLGAIDLAIENGSFGANQGLLDFIAQVKARGGVAHLMGVASDGGVHGHIDHVLAAVRAVAGAGVPVVLHAITDGRDVAPSSAADYVAALQAGLPVGAVIGTVIGRYWAMDRDTRWDRVQRAYDAIVHGVGEVAANAGAAVSASYIKGETDEFLAPTVVGGYAGARDGDGFFCLNFRADRAREILSALGDPAFTGFARGTMIHWAAMLGMVDYSIAHNVYMTAAYPKPVLTNTLGEWVAAHHRTQFRLAETEKYPHVTFFLNGGKELPSKGEDRYMPKSPKVALRWPSFKPNAFSASLLRVAVSDRLTRGMRLPSACRTAASACSICARLIARSGFCASAAATHCLYSSVSALRAPLARIDSPAMTSRPNKRLFMATLQC